MKKNNFVSLNEFKMEKQEFYCLCTTGLGSHLELVKVADLIKQNKVAEKALEIDLHKGEWRYINQDGFIQSMDWSKIGERSHWGNDGKLVRLVFDLNNHDQLKKAFDIAGSFYSEREDWFS